MTQQDAEFSISEFVQKIEAARKVREEGKRSFELAGETFTHKPAVDMETMAAYFDMTTLRVDLSNTEAINVLDQTVLAFLEPGQEEKWHKIRHEGANPLTYEDVHTLIEGLLRSLTGRPTGPSIDSTDGRENGTTTLTDVSHSKEPTSTE